MCLPTHDKHRKVSRLHSGRGLTASHYSGDWHARAGNVKSPPSDAVLITPSTFALPRLHLCFLFIFSAIISPCFYTLLL